MMYYQSKFQNENEFVCHICNRSYKRKTTLYRHQKYECGVEPKFECPICGRKFKRKEYVIGHVLGRHGKNYKFLVK